MNSIMTPKYVSFICINIMQIAYMWWILNLNFLIWPTSQLKEIHIIYVTISISKKYKIMYRL